MTRTELRGAAPDVVREALARGDPLPGASFGPPELGGFAGAVDGALVRDVLGREPLFVEAGIDSPATEGAWAFDRAALADPTPVPAGVRLGPAGDDLVWSLPNPEPAPPEEALTGVRGALVDALGLDDAGGRRTGDDADSADGSVAVAFSGGLDSGLVAAGLPDAPRYVAGFEGSHDVAAARAAAEASDSAVDLRVLELSHGDIERAVPEVARATGRTNPMDVAIALPLYLVAERAAADGFDRLALGQGADELFGGYSKVVEPASDHRVEAETVRGATREVVATLPEQLERDVLALRAAGVEPVTPFLRDRVVDAALRLPASLLATPDERKIALRRVAEAEGVLPESVAAAEKKAVQYGTYVSRELDRLARRAGFKRRMDDHVGRYVRSLLD